MIGEIVPVLGVLVGLVVPLACFFGRTMKTKASAMR
jgi:hypothetical protein